MTRMLAALAAGALALALTGCGASYDAAGFEMVTSYIDEQTRATQRALLDPTVGNADTIVQINQRYWDNPDWPDEDEITSWQLMYGPEGREEPMHGEEIADVVFELNSASGFLASVIHEDRGAAEAERAANYAQDAIQQAHDLFRT